MKNNTNNLGKKRLEAVFTLVGYAAGGSAAAALPTPCAEIPKQIVLSASDVFMYANIWKIYFEEELSRQDLLAMLAEMGLIAAASLGTAYVVSRATTAIVKEIGDWCGPMGWGVTALVSGSLTGLFGAAWIYYCDRLCQHRIQPA